MGDESGYGRSLKGLLFKNESGSSEVHVAINREGVVHWRDDGPGIEDSASAEQPRSLLSWEGMTISWLDGTTISIAKASEGLRLSVPDAEAFLTRLERYGSPEIRVEVNRLWNEASQRTERHPLMHVGMLVLVMIIAIAIWHGLTYVEAAIVDNCVPLSLDSEIARHIEPNFLGSRKKSHHKVTAAVQQILDRLIAQWPKERRAMYKDTMSIAVIDEKTMNAFALPAGRILVFSELVSAAERPSQVAAVLAHELSHVSHRDGMKRIAGQIKWRLLYAYLAGDMSADQEFILQRAESLSSLKYSRSMEERADREGLELMMKAGFDGRGAAELFTIMFKKGPNIMDTLNFLSDHPATPERIKYLKEVFEEFENDKTINKKIGKVFEGDWEEIRRLASQGAAN